MGLSLAILLLSIGWLLLYSAIKNLDPMSEIASIFTGVSQAKRPAPAPSPAPPKARP